MARFASRIKTPVILALVARTHEHRGGMGGAVSAGLPTPCAWVVGTSPTMTEKGASVPAPAFRGENSLCFTQATVPDGTGWSRVSPAGSSLRDAQRP